MSIILIGEDEPILRHMMIMGLQDEGQEVLVGRDGQEVIDLLRGHAPDLVLLDLIMPKVDGFAVLTHIQEKGIEIPVIILSNISDPDDIERCRKLGAVDFIVKSDLEHDDLWPVVSKHLGNRHEKTACYS